MLKGSDVGSPSVKEEEHFPARRCCYDARRGGVLAQRPRRVVRCVCCGSRMGTTERVV
jgi:hypothetical protein